MSFYKKNDMHFQLKMHVAAERRAFSDGFVCRSLQLEMHIVLWKDVQTQVKQLEKHVVL